MTLGYEGLDVHAFLGELKANRVATLVDVRELPLSRKKGFSKSTLAAEANAVGIGFVHIPALGCPREIRKDYYGDRDWGRYKRRFNTYLHKQKTELDKLRALAEQKVCCLVCFEADYRLCHRSLITAALAVEGQMQIRHLTVRSPASFAGLEPAFA
jgi:uncharacterized protein (DUF488 family)